MPWECGTTRDSFLNAHQVVASHQASVEADIAVAVMHARELAGISERARALVRLIEASGQWACL